MVNAGAPGCIPYVVPVPIHLGAHEGRQLPAANDARHGSRRKSVASPLKVAYTPSMPVTIPGQFEHEAPNEYIVTIRTFRATVPEPVYWYYSWMISSAGGQIAGYSNAVDPFLTRREAYDEAHRQALAEMVRLGLL